eukprot:6208256-Pleurochrysis_carterae.AAC.5
MGWGATRKLVASTDTHSKSANSWAASAKSFRSFLPTCGISSIHDTDGSKFQLSREHQRGAPLLPSNESVAQLAHSSWARPPFFANADDQANLNDVLASALTGDEFFGAG